MNYQKFKELVSDPRKEFERAIINQGNFKLTDCYSFMIISQEKWCKMSEDAHNALLRRFHHMPVIDASQEPCASTESFSWFCFCRFSLYPAKGFVAEYLG